MWVFLLWFDVVAIEAPSSEIGSQRRRQERYGTSPWNWKIFQKKILFLKATEDENFAEIMIKIYINKFSIQFLDKTLKISEKFEKFIEFLLQKRKVLPHCILFCLINSRYFHFNKNRVVLQVFFKFSRKNCYYLFWFVRF